MDGTILDSMGMWDDIGSGYLRSLDITPRPGLRQELIPLTLRQSAGYFREHYGVDKTDEEMMEGFAALLKDHYENHLVLKPGALKFMRRLKERGVKLCLATATDRSFTEAAVKRLGIIDMFEFIITCQEVGSNKSSPDIFDECLRRLGTSKGDTMIFEDAVHAIRCAKQNGYRVCAVRDKSADRHRDEIESLADFSVDRLDELEVDAL